MTIIPAARITGERLVAPREIGGREMEGRELAAIREAVSIFPQDYTVVKLLAEVDRLRQELHQSQAREGAMREALEMVIYRCEAHCGTDGNPNWGENSIEYQYFKQALAGEGGAG